MSNSVEIPQSMIVQIPLLRSDPVTPRVDIDTQYYGNGKDGIVQNASRRVSLSAQAIPDTQSGGTCGTYGCGIGVLGATAHAIEVLGIHLDGAVR